MTAVEPAPSPTVELEVHEDLAERVTGYLHASRAASTRRAYRSDWNDFVAWCLDHGRDSLPADQATLVGYLDACVTRGLKLSTISRRVSAIKSAHQAAGAVPQWTAGVDEVWRGIRRQLGVAPDQKAPATLTIVDRLLDQLDLETTAGLRDRALLLVGFSGAFRRSELVAIDVEDLDDREGGLVVHVRRSKADQEGKGAELGIPYAEDTDRCPVRALRAWLEAAGIDEGAVFRGVDRWGKVRASRLSSQSVALVVKRHAKAAGLDPDRFAGHSLRAGLATAAAEAGVREDVIQGQTRHKSVEMLRTYVRRGSLFRENAAAAVFATRS